MSKAKSGERPRVIAFNCRKKIGKNAPRTSKKDLGVVTINIKFGFPV